MTDGCDVAVTDGIGEPLLGDSLTGRLDCACVAMGNANVRIKATVAARVSQCLIANDNMVFLSFE